MPAEPIETLQNSELFGGADMSLLQRIVNAGEKISWPKGESLSPDIAQKDLFVILEGRLKLSQVDPHTGRSITLFLLGSGDIYDIFTLLDNAEHITFPVTLDRVEALRIPLPQAREWLCRYPELSNRFLPYLGKMMRHLEAFSESMVFDDTMTRLAKLILRHVDPQKSQTDGHHPVQLIHNLSHESLAEMIGSVRAVVSTQIHKLKDQDIIFSKRGHLAVKNLEALRKKSDLALQCLCPERKNRKADK